MKFQTGAQHSDEECKEAAKYLTNLVGSTWKVDGRGFLSAPMAENDEVHKSLYKMISKNSEILACQTYIEGHREDEVSGGQKQNFVQEALEEKSTKC